MRDISSSDALASLIRGRGYRFLCHYAEHIGLSRQTLTNKVNNPRTMTCGELIDIADDLRMSDEALLAFVKGCRRERVSKRSN